MNVEELLDSKDLQYIRKGRDYVVRCVNPEHDDRNPSMRIDSVTGVFNCFSCEYKGNIFVHYGQKLNKLQLRKEMLKQKLSTKMSEGVGLQMPSTAVEYEGDWRGISPETYKKFDAFTSHDTDYRGRIVFPIRDITGRICAFQGRHTTGETPKYLNTPPNSRLPLFPKVEGIKGSIILVEGIFDMLNLHDKGLTNAMCCFGVKNVNEDRVNILKMQGISKIYIFLDGDEAGQAGAEKIKNICSAADMDYSNIYLAAKDPGDLTSEQVAKLKNQLYGVKK